MYIQADLLNIYVQQWESLDTVPVKADALGKVWIQLLQRLVYIPRKGRVQLLQKLTNLGNFGYGYSKS
jgi:hypothetical protein